MTWQPITQAEARGDSAPLPWLALDALARRGERILAEQHKPGSVALASVVDSVASDAWSKIQDAWGGATYDLDTGKPVDVAQGWAVATTSATRRLALGADVEQIRQALLDVAEHGDGGSVGIFRDDDLGAVDVDAVYLAETEDDAVAVGVARHAVGGAYDFATGRALWMPHLADERESFTYEGAPRRRRRLRRVDALSSVYNEVPETRGTSRGAGVIADGGRDLDDQTKLDAWRASHVA